MELAAELKQAWGWHTVLCVLGRDEGGLPGTVDPPPVVHLNSPVQERGNLIKRLAGLKRLVAELQPSIVHSHLWPAALAVGMVTHSQSFFHVVHIRDTPPAFSAMRWRSRVRTRITGTILRGAGTRLVAVSRDAGDYAIEHLRLRPEAVRVVLDGIPAKNHTVADGRERDSRSTYTVGMAGRLSAEKAHAVMIESLALLSASAQPVRLRIAGTGSQAAALAELASRHGVAERVQLAGEVSDMEAFYASLDCFVHCAMHSEGLPRVTD